MAGFDGNTGLDFWLNIPVKDIHAWLELMNEQISERKRLMQKQKH